MTLISDSNTSPKPALIVFERTSRGRQRASWFTAEDANDAEEAAKPLGYMILRINDEAGQQLVAAQLPRGDYTREAGAGVPFVRRERLNRVLREIAPNLLDLAPDTGNASTKNKVIPVRPAQTCPF